MSALSDVEASDDAERSSLGGLCASHEVVWTDSAILDTPCQSRPLEPVMPDVHVELFETLSKRYSGATPNALMAVMCPLLIPIRSLDKSIVRMVGQTHYRATFTIEITEQNETVIQIGRTGKFVPINYASGGVWNEIAKGRIVSIDYSSGVAEGEIYTGESSKASLEDALNNLQPTDLWEVDQYGASAKILSALAEYFLVEHGKERGYQVTRMPEDMARHLGAYANFDFLFRKGSVTRRVEAKSLWGTNTQCARLIHSTTTRPKGDPSTWTDDQKKTYYPTSSCKFTTQDIFAVNLFLREGDIRKFAFARSISQSESNHGLPYSPGYPEHLHQNPRCEIDNQVWFDSIDQVWDLDF